MSTPEYIDRTGASSGKFAVRLHTIESAPDAPESLRWRVAVAVNDQGAYCGGCDYEDGLDCSECRHVCLEYADAAIAAIITAQSGTDR